MLFTFTTACCRDGDADGLQRRWQSMAPPHRRGRPPPHAAFALASRLDRRDDTRLPHLVADRPWSSLFHTREQKNGLLESSGSLGEQDGADAVQDGADAQPHGDLASLSPWLRLRPALKRQPRVRRVPLGYLAAA